MTLLLRPRRGGFLRTFGCGWFIREFLSGNAPHGSTIIDPMIGAPQSDVFYEYKNALRRAMAMARAIKAEEKKAKREKRAIDPARIEQIYQRYLIRLPYKSIGCRYHSFVGYFSTLRKLGWVEPSGKIEASAFQDNYPQGKPRVYYRLNRAGMQASEREWADPHKALYG